VLSLPKEIWEWPPGGAWMRVVGRSVMPLPQFWSDPFAKALLEETRPPDGAPCVTPSPPPPNTLLAIALVPGVRVKTHYA